jgi:transposase InsO family protein
MLYKEMQEEGSKNGWEHPSYQTVARYINYLMEEKRGKNAQFLAAKGAREYRNKIMVKASRDSKSLPVMGLVQGDVHTFDCWVKYTYPNGKVTAIKPNLVGWVDVRSRAIVSSVMCLYANAEVMKQSILVLGYNEIGGRSCGLPQWINIDNGKEYTAETLTGRKRKERVSFDSETIGFYRSIGIQDDIRSLPYQPWSKSYIERFFGTVCSEFTKRMASYTGTLTGSRTAAKVKKDVTAMLERDELLTLEEFYVLWQTWLQEKYHQKEHGGLKKAKEKWLKPAELFANAEERYYKPAPPKSYATMLMMRADRVHVYNTGIHKFGYEYRADELCDYINDKVDIRWDPVDVTRLYVYTRDGKKICEALSQELLLIAPKVPQKALEEHIKSQRKQLKRDRERLKEYTTPIEARINQHVNGPSDTVGGFIIKKAGKKPVDNVVAMPGDKQFREEVGSKKQNQGNNEFYQKKAEKALAILRQLG